MRWLVVAISLLFFLMPSCRREMAGKRTVVVAAAADLKYALDEMVGDFQAEHPDLEILVSYGSSGNFYTQISQGAPFDLYLSADIEFPRLLVNRGDADGDSLFQYGMGSIVLWIPHGLDLPLAGEGLRVLLDPRVRKVAIAHPEHAPYGRAAVAAMRDAGVYDAVCDKLVLGENVAQAASFVETGNAELGVIALSLASGPKMRSRGRYWEVPRDQFPALVQAGVIPKRAKNPVGAGKFRAWMMSEKGREVLLKHGFKFSAAP
ncbi:MAG: Molybdenum transporter, periplasmic molybdate-binding protein [Verrucomicrobiota bacterium]